MENQLQKFDGRYKVKKQYNEMSELQKFTLDKLIDAAVKEFKVGHKIGIKQMINKLRPSYSKEEVLNSYHLTNGALAYALVKRTDIIWINCDCGGLGLFQYKGE